jgi:hypothetical protein
MPPVAAAPLHVGASVRVRLARLALDAALAIPGVLSAEAGLHGLRVTVDPPRGLLRGVSVTAQADGRYSVDLRLVTRMVPLVALAEEVRHEVHARARRNDLDNELGTVNVEFGGLLTTEEAAADAGYLGNDAVVGVVSARPPATSAASPATPVAAPPQPRTDGAPNCAATGCPPSPPADTLEKARGG